MPDMLVTSLVEIGTPCTGQMAGENGKMASVFLKGERTYKVVH